MPVPSRVLAAIFALLVSLPGAFAQPAAGTQYVIISFDGAHHISQWQRSRALADNAGATFTYFLSCTFLLSPETRHAYQAPGTGSGRSNVGFAASKQEVADRLTQIWNAHSEGHEIANHGCGHFDGKDWNKTDWHKEFDAFSTILRDAYTINGINEEPEGWKAFAGEIHGFRAPYLSMNEALFAALADRNFTYEASGVAPGPTRPKEKGGIMHFALPLIPEGPSKRRVVAMDYNLFVRHSGGTEKPDTDAIFENRTYEAFVNAFEAQYSGSRIPLQIGFHFTLMNDGAYWRALERFAQDVCKRQDVACVSYRDYLERTAPSKGVSTVGLRS